MQPVESLDLVLSQPMVHWNLQQNTTGAALCIQMEFWGPLAKMLGDPYFLSMRVHDGLPGSSLSYGGDAVTSHPFPSLKRCHFTGDHEATAARTTLPGRPQTCYNITTWKICLKISSFKSFKWIHNITSFMTLRMNIQGSTPVKFFQANDSGISLWSKK